jgi:hypothetical protein
MQWPGSWGGHKLAIAVGEPLKGSWRQQQLLLQQQHEGYSRRHAHGEEGSVAAGCRESATLCCAVVILSEGMAGGAVSVVLTAVAQLLV